MSVTVAVTVTRSVLTLIGPLSGGVGRGAGDCAEIAAAENAITKREASRVAKRGCSMPKRLRIHAQLEQFYCRDSRKSVQRIFSDAAGCPQVVKTGKFPRATHQHAGQGTCRAVSRVIIRPLNAPRSGLWCPKSNRLLCLTSSAGSELRPAK